MHSEKTFYVRGNYTTLSDLPHILHPYATLPIVQPNKEKQPGNIPLANETNVVKAKKFVDQNHK